MLARPLSFPRTAQTLGLLALVTASVVMALLLGLAVEQPADFISRNVLPDGLRVALLTAPTGAGLAVAATGLVLIWRKKEPALLWLEKLARYLSPLWLLWALPVLLSYAAWSSRPLEFLLLLAVFALALERALRWSLSAVPAPIVNWARQKVHSLNAGRRRLIPLAVVVTACVLYATYFSYATIQEHHRLTTGTLDLGISDNLMANMLAGKFFRVPALLPDGSSMLRGHALFGALFYLPLYAIHPSSEAMLAIQATLMGFAALPLYLFASTQIPRAYACLLAICYLLSPILHGPNFYDFHFLSISPIFHFFLYLGIARRKLWLTGLAWLALVLTREDLSMSMIPLACVLALSGVRVKTGLIIAGASAIAFVLIKFVIMPAAGSWFFSDHYAGLYLPGHQSFGSAIVTILTNPALLLTSLFTVPKLTFALHVFAPLLFLTWRNAWLFAATLGAFPSTLMVTNGIYVTNIGFQYVTHWVPYVFGGAAVGIRLMNQRVGAPARKLAAILALATAVILHSWVFGAVLQRNSFTAAAKPIPLRMTDAERADYAALKELRAMIPKEAIVAASPQMYPHISNRADAYDLESAHGNAEYLLVSPRSVAKTQRTLRELLPSVAYGLLAQRGTIYLFKRNHVNPETSKAWRTLGIRGRTQPRKAAQPTRKRPTQGGAHRP